MMEVTGQVVSIPLTDIFADVNFNCRGRITPLDVTELAASIEERGGLIQPVRVCPMPADYPNPDNKTYLLMAGYRRFTAHKVLMVDASRWSSIDCIIDERITTELEARYVNLSENLDREDLTILQEAMALKQLKDRGVTEQGAMEKLRKSRGWIQIRWMLLDLPTEIQIEVEAKVITQTQVRELYSVLINQGEEACFGAAKTIKEQKAKGRRNISVNPNKKKNAKRIRTKNEIFDRMAYIQEGGGLGNGVWTRMLAWCAGEIDDNEMHMSLKKHALENGLNYVIPID